MAALDLFGGDVGAQCVDHDLQILAHPGVFLRRQVSEQPLDQLFVECYPALADIRPQLRHVGIELVQSEVAGIFRLQFRPRVEYLERVAVALLDPVGPGECGTQQRCQQYQNPGGGVS